MVREKAAPQSTAPAAAAGRATRAQSQEIASTAPLPVARAARRKGQAEEVPVETAAATARKGRKNAVLEDLNAIDEDAADQVDVSDDVASHPAPAVPETQDVAQVAAADGMDDTASALDRDLMLEELGDLYTHAEQLLALTAQMPDSAAGDFTSVLTYWRQMGAKSNNLLRQRVKKFNLSKDVFTSDPNGMYIKKINACNAMLGDDHFETHRETARKLDEVFHLANLAELAAALITYDNIEEAKVLMLELTNPVHPDPFMSSFLQHDLSASTAGNALAIGSSNLLDETFLIGLEIRTQVALASFANNVSEPETVLKALFIDDSAKGSKVTFRGWNSVNLGGDEAPLAAKYQKIVKKRYNDLVTAGLADESNAAIFQGLQQKFPWDAFVAKVFGWISSRDIEIQQSIQLRGGIEGIVQSVDAAINGPPTTTIAPVANMGSQVGTQGSKRKSLLASAMLRNAAGFLAEPEGNADTSTFLQSDSQLRDAELPRALTPAGSPPLEIAEDVDMNQAEPEGLAQPVDEAAGKNLQDLSTAALRLTQLRAQDERNRNAPVPTVAKSVFDARKRGFVDAQDGAEAVTFESQTPAKAKANGKRKQGAEDEEGVSEDDGFAEDTRNIDANARRAAKAAAADTYSPSDDLPLPSASKRQKIGTATGASTKKRPGTLVRPTQTQPPPKPRAERPDDAADPPAPSQSFLNYKATQQLAKSNTAQLINKPRQARVPWSESEEQALFDFIQSHGCQWSLIKKTDDAQDKLLVKRDQVALKDKARNMYFDFLKAGHTELPANFTSVTLSTAQKNKLIAMGLWGDNGPVLARTGAVDEVEPEVEAEVPAAVEE